MNVGEIDQIPLVADGETVGTQFLLPGFNGAFCVDFFLTQRKADNLLFGINCKEINNIMQIYGLLTAGGVDNGVQQFGSLYIIQNLR